MRGENQRRPKFSETILLIQTHSIQERNGQAACTPSEIKPDVVPVGLSPPLKFSLIEPVLKVVKMLSFHHKIWSLVINKTMVVKVVILTKLGIIFIILVLSLILAIHTPLEVVKLLA